MSLPQGFLPFDSDKDSANDSCQLETHEEATSGGGVLLVRHLPTDSIRRCISISIELGFSQ